MPAEFSTAYKWVDEKMNKRYREYLDKGPWCCVIKTDEKLKQVRHLCPLHCMASLNYINPMVVTIFGEYC